MRLKPRITKSCLFVLFVLLFFFWFSFRVLVAFANQLSLRFLFFFHILGLILHILVWSVNFCQSSPSFSGLNLANQRNTPPEYNKAVCVSYNQMLQNGSMVNQVKQLKQINKIKSNKEVYTHSQIASIYMSIAILHKKTQSKGK